MRLGVFGGTFDPPHIAHRIVAQDALETLALDRVLFVPAAVPPHKRDVARTPPALRLEMVRALIAGDPRFEVSTVELDRPGPSFTADTLEALHQAHPGAELFLLIGADQWREFATWRRTEEIFRLARVCVLGREGERAGAGAAGGAERHVAVTRVDLSSTEVRERVRAGRSIRYLVPRGVAEVIERENLYGG